MKKNYKLDEIDRVCLPCGKLYSGYKTGYTPCPYCSKFSEAWKCCFCGKVNREKHICEGCNYDIRTWSFSVWGDDVIEIKCPFCYKFGKYRKGTSYECNKCGQVPTHWICPNIKYLDEICNTINNQQKCKKCKYNIKIKECFINSWSCRICTFDNNPHLLICEICESYNPIMEYYDIKKWACRYCGNIND